jgi:hypothetical protein
MSKLSELKSIRDRHETINYGIVYYGVGWDDVNAELVHADRATLLAHVDRLSAELAKAEARIDPASKQWDRATVGVLPDDDSATFFIKMATFAEARIAEGEQWMSISMKQYAELLKSAARAALKGT